MHRSTAKSVVLSVALWCSGAEALVAQCQPVAWAGSPGPGCSGTVYDSTSWDPDGPGPLTAIVVLAGSFTDAGAAPSRSIAAWDPVTAAFTGFGNGLDGVVKSVLAHPNGELVAGLSTPQAPFAATIHTWNGTTWSTLPGTFDGEVHTMTALANGDLVVGGSFHAVGAVAAEGLARWDGSAWNTFGTGVATGTVERRVRASLTLPNGDLIVGGRFPSIDGVACNGIARWDGATWNPMGSGSAATVYDLARLPNGNVVAVGDFGSLGGSLTGKIAQWDGTAWSPLGPVMTSGFEVRTVAVLTNGTVAIGGDLQNSTVRLLLGTWSAIGASEPVNTLTAFAGGSSTLVAGGEFQFIGSTSLERIPVSHAAQWDSRFGWSRLYGGGFDGFTYAAAAGSDGMPLVGGAFAKVDGTSVNGVARFDGSAWQALGTGVELLASPSSRQVRSILPLPGGQIVVGGAFSSAGGSPAANVARWDGANWQPMGAGVPTLVFALAQLQNGDIVAAGSGGVIRRWDGASWSQLGADADARIWALTVLPDGDLLAGGEFSIIGGVAASRVARWDGTTWHAQDAGSSLDVAHCFAQSTNGDLYVGGNGPLSFGGVLRWNGASWVPASPNQPSDAVYALAALPGGRLLVGGVFIGAFVPGSGPFLAVLTGPTWSSVGGASNSVFGMATLADGDVALVGAFDVVGGASSPFFARIGSTCPSSSVSHGSGCTGPGGLMELRSTSAPYLGGRYESATTGFGGLSLGVWFLGLSSISVPLASLLPEGGAGCDLLATQDALVQLLLPTGSTVTAGVPLPLDPQLLGLVLEHQVVQLEFDATTFALSSVTSSNGLTLTLGSY